MLTLQIQYDDGDVITTRFNGSLDEALDYYPEGAWRNIGDGPNDCYKQIKRVLIFGKAG